MARSGTAARGGGIVGSFPQLCPRLLSREQAAAYIGHHTTKWDELVAEGVMPKPVKIERSARKLWDRYDIDQSVEEQKSKADDTDDTTKAKQAWEDRLKD
jgi:hypothetical protein